MKTAEELKSLKNEFDALNANLNKVNGDLLKYEISSMNAKLAELTQEELEVVTGGGIGDQCESRRWYYCPYSHAFQDQMRHNVAYYCETCPNAYWHQIN